MDLRALDAHLMTATVQISGAGGRGRFGTGFIVHRAGDAAIVLTCAHVVEDVGGPAGLQANGLPATLLAAGSPQAIDLAVLHVPMLPGAPLPLLPNAATPVPDEALQIVGFKSLGANNQIHEALDAQLGRQVEIGQANPHERAQAWRLRLTGEQGLEPGFSGAPALGLASGRIVGVVSWRQGIGAGLAIAAYELRRLWPDCPDAVFTRPSLIVQPTLPAPQTTLAPAEAGVAEALIQQLRAGLKPALQPGLSDLVDALLPFIASALAKGQSTTQVPVSLTGASALDALAGQEVRTENAVLNFGAGSQFGDIQVRDVAGGNIVNAQIYLDGRPPQPPPPAAPLAAPLRVALLADPDGQRALAPLRDALALRGLVALPNPDQPGLTPAATLVGAAAAVLYLSPDRLEEGDLEDDMLALKVALAAQPELPTLTLLDGVSTRAARRAGIDGPLLQGAEPYQAETALALAGRLLRNSVARHQAQILTGSAATVGLFSFDPTGPGAGASLCLDWRPLFGNNRYPSEDEWRTQLMPALADLRQTLGAAGVSAITLHIAARLSAALAFGHRFRSVAGVSLALPQKEGIWHTRPYDPALAPLIPELIELDPAGTELSVELPITQDRVTSDVDAWIASQRPPLQRRVILRPPGGSGMAIDDETAHAIACQVRRVILEHQQPVHTTHLFAAIPAGLAAMIGWHLNTCEPVQCYELERNATLRPACLLEGGA